MNPNTRVRVTLPTGEKHGGLTVTNDANGAVLVALDQDNVIPGNRSEVSELRLVVLAKVDELELEEPEAPEAPPTHHEIGPA